MIRPTTIAFTAALLLFNATSAYAAEFSATRDLQCSTRKVDAAVGDAANEVLRNAVAHLRGIAGDTAQDDDLVNLLSGNLRMHIDVTNSYKNGRTPCPTVTVTGTVPADIETQAASLAPQQQSTPAADATTEAATEAADEMTPLSERTYFEPQDWELELQKATLAVATDPKDATALARRSVALSHLQRPTEALEAVNKALAADQNNPEALYARGLVYSNYGQYEKAAQDFSAAIDQRPNDARAYVQRGIAFKKLSHFQEAVTDFDRALLTSPGDMTVYMNRGIAYAGLDRMDMAVADLGSAIQLAPEDPWPYIYRGLAFYQTEEYPLMCKDFQKAETLGKPEGTTWAKRKGLCE